MASQSPAVPPNQLPTLLLCGGGTGGHVYPALAVAEALRGEVLTQHLAHGIGRGQMAEPSLTREPPVGSASQTTVEQHARPRVVYVGSADGMEAGLVATESDLPFRAISAAAVRGRNPLTLARNSMTLGRGTLEARRLLRELRPGAILGTGGYVCVPLFVAARALRVPTVIYLPDVVPGLAVRVLGRLATVVACNVEDSAKYFGLTIDGGAFGEVEQKAATNRTSKIQNRTFTVTGYPVRQELFEQDKAACRAAFGLNDQLPVLLVYGGSRGARSINQAIGTLLPHILPLAQVVHVCGREGDESFLRAAAAKLPSELQERYKLFPYLHSVGAQQESGHNNPVARLGVALETREPTPSMISAFGAADLAVCRSGASTLAELPAAGLPAVLVPYPFVHQEENADYLVARGAAVKVLDSEMVGTGQPESGPLFHYIQRLLLAPEERLRMSERSRALARPDAARRLAALLLDLATSTRTER